MASYLVNRLGQSLILLALVSVIGFALLHLAQADPCRNSRLFPA